MTDEQQKIFVLDTNVILHDSSCIERFKEHDVVIPMVVLEELDNFKKGNESINYHAREFVRRLDEMTDDTLFDGGVELGEGLGRFSIKIEKDFHEDLQNSFRGDLPDHRILNVAYCQKLRNPDKEVVLVTKDVNLRMKAKSIGVWSENYLNDQVKSVSDLYTGHRLVEDLPDELLAQLFQEPHEILRVDLPLDEDLYPNEFLILRNEKRSVLAYYNAENETICRILKTEAYGIESRNAEQAFALAALLNDDIKLATISGKAGTGKTLLSLAASLECRKNYLQIYLARPVVPLSNKDIGYLPGDISSKLLPYMKPLYDNLGVIQNQFSPSDRMYKQIATLQENEKLKIEPLAYIRGRSLVKIYFIVDEAQNLTPHEVKTLITRAGEGTKIIFTGDIFQIDHPYLDTQSNGLSYLIERMKGQPLYAHINLEKGERSELAELASNLL